MDAAGKNLSIFGTLDSTKLTVRVGMAAIVLGTLILVWFGVRWQLGNMLADLTSPSDPNARDVAAMALNFSPGDPSVNWLAASIRKNNFAPETVSATAKDFERVVQLAPYEYRWWGELGRAREQADETNSAEQAFLRAVELAPEYTFPHWQLGNFYLRQDESEKAFAELKKTASTNSIYRDQVFSIVWDYSDKNTARLEEIAGNSPATRAGLAKFYASKERAEDALRIWNSLSNAEKEENTAIARVIAQAFYEKRIFRQAQEFVRSLGIEPESRFETVQNGSFESSIGNIKETFFGWKSSPIDKIEVKLDPTQKHDGSRSLRMSFNGYAEPTLYSFFQYITVQPSANYRLTFWVRTENLKSGGPPALEIFNAKDDKNIVLSEPFPIGTNDWQQVKLEFTAPANTDAVGIRTVRLFCGVNCPILGTFWYDDFKLEKLNSADAKSQKSK